MKVTETPQERQRWLPISRVDSGRRITRSQGTRLGSEAGRSSYKPWKMAVGWGVPSRSPALLPSVALAVTAEL